MNLIIGQGIAGTTLALRLIARGEEVKVVDNGYKNSSSQVAAGLWNPIVFRRINQSWRADDFIPELERFYPAMEKMLKARFYYPLQIFRVHASKKEHDLWFEKKVKPGFQPFLENREETLRYFKNDEMPFGTGFVNHAGHLDVPAYLNAARQYFIRHNVYAQTEIELPEDPQKMDAFTWKGKTVKRIVDCRGSASALSPWWEYLPFGPTKGELLTIRCPNLNLEKVFNAGFFFFPLGNDLYKLGATFEWDFEDAAPTKEGKNHLLSKLDKWLDMPYEVVKHEAGIRPTIQDRRPLFGKHPNSGKLHIFNGLGTKGVMLAPWLSIAFCNYLMDGKQLPDKTDISRFDYLLGQKNPEISHP